MQSEGDQPPRQHCRGGPRARAGQPPQGSQESIDFLTSLGAPTWKHRRIPNHPSQHPRMSVTNVIMVKNIVRGASGVRRPTPANQIHALRNPIPYRQLKSNPPRGRHLPRLPTKSMPYVTRSPLDEDVPHPADVAISHACPIREL